MGDDELLILLRKYRKNLLSEEEYFRLRTWMDKSSKHRLFMGNFMKMYKLENQYKAVRLINVSQAWWVFCKRRKGRIRRMVVNRIAVACLAGLFFYGCMALLQSFFRQREPSELSELLLNHGSRKAVLTLVDGEKIEINDSIMAISEAFLCASTKMEESDKKESDADETRLNEVAVPRGGEFSLVLPDGTKVWINSESTLSFPSRFSDTRVVTLQGEAYFDVMKTGLPFEVKTPNTTIRVLGTQFNVSAYESEATLTTLVQGGVEVENVWGKAKLYPGQQAEVLSGDAPIEVREVNVSMYTAWVTGIFDFDNTSLEEIMAQLSRWYNVKVEFASPALCQIRFSGTVLRKESLGYALEIIRKVSDVEFVKKDDLIRVEKKIERGKSSGFPLLK